MTEESRLPRESSISTFSYNELVLLFSMVQRTKEGDDSNSEDEAPEPANEHYPKYN